MRYIKTYEQNNIKPQIGDYVVVKIDKYYEDAPDTYNLYNFINSNVGLVVDKDKYRIFVEFENVPENIKKFFLPRNVGTFGNSVIIYTKTVNYDDVCFFSSNDDVCFFSSNKKDCEVFLNSKKYNL